MKYGEIRQIQKYDIYRHDIFSHFQGIDSVIDGDIISIKYDDDDLLYEKQLKKNNSGLLDGINFIEMIDKDKYETVNDKKEKKGKRSKCNSKDKDIKFFYRRQISGFPELFSDYNNDIKHKSAFNLICENSDNKEILHIQKIKSSVKTTAIYLLAYDDNVLDKYKVVNLVAFIFKNKDLYKNIK